MHRSVTQLPVIDEPSTPSELPAVVASSPRPRVEVRSRLRAGVGAMQSLAGRVARHPWVNHPLAILVPIGAVLLALPSLAAAVQGVPAPVPAASAEIVAEAASVAAPTAAAVAAPTPTHESRHDDDDEDEPPVDHHAKHASAAPTSHAPDAKAGPATGYRDGAPIHLVLTMLDGKPVEVQTAAAFKRMRAAAQKAGVTLTIVSGFRTMERQKELYADYQAGRGHLAAVPGHSNHQSGHALDLAVGSAKTRAWLEAHAAAFDFHRTVPSEAWHWERP